MPSLNDPRLDVLVSLGNWLRGQDYRFVTVTPATHERVNARPENRMARDLAGIFGWSRAFAGESLPADWLTLLAGADLIRREADGWRSQVRVSSSASNCSSIRPSLPWPPTRCSSAPTPTASTG